MKDYKKLISIVRESEELQHLISEMWNKSQMYGFWRYYVLYYDWSENIFFYTEDYSDSYMFNDNYEILFGIHSTNNPGFDPDEDDEADWDWDCPYFIIENYIDDIVNTLSLNLY